MAVASSSTRRTLAWTLLIGGAALAGAVYWAVWVVMFLFGPTPSSVLGAASIGAALTTAASLWLGARLVASRARFAFIPSAILWLATSFLPERLVAGYHTLPPFCLLYQVPLSLCLAGALWMARVPRGPRP
jgi:hypothetical protein